MTCPEIIGVAGAKMRILAGLALIITMGSLAFQPAFADGRRDGRRHDDHRGHHFVRHDYGYDHRYYGGYPPPIVYAPPPPNFGLNIVIPLKFR